MLQEKTCANCRAFHPVRRCWAAGDFASQPNPQAVCEHHESHALGDVQSLAGFAATVKYALVLKSQWVRDRVGPQCEPQTYGETTSLNAHS